MLTDELKNKIAAVSWENYETAYGNAAEDISDYLDSSKHIPKVMKSLGDLFSDDIEVAMQATHDLWCMLCHQHAFVSSAALPAYDFLVMALKTINEELQIEILDIMRGFAVCTYRCKDDMNWQEELRRKLEGDIDYYKALSVSENEDIAEFAQEIVEELKR